LKEELQREIERECEEIKMDIKIERDLVTVEVLGESEEEWHELIYSALLSVSEQHLVKEKQYDELLIDSE